MDKYPECKNCFWNITSYKTWKTFSGTYGRDPAVQIEEIKAKKCKACEKASNYSEVWRCKKCETIIDGHQYFLHASLCESCWDSLTPEEANIYLNSIEDEEDEEFEDENLEENPPIPIRKEIQIEPKKCFFCFNDTDKYNKSTYYIVCKNCRNTPKGKYIYSAPEIRKALHLYLPKDFYYNWKHWNANEKPISVSELKYNRKKYLSCYIDIIGKLVYKGEKKGYSGFFSNDKFRYSLVQDLRNSDTILIRCSGSDVGNNLFKEEIGETLLLFIKTAQTRESNVPIYYEYFMEKTDMIEHKDKLQRQSHRHDTFYLYPKVYKKYLYRCGICQSKEKLSIHHKDYEKHKTEEELFNSMIPLCEKCHNKITHEQIKGQKFRRLNEFFE